MSLSPCTRVTAHVLNTSLLMTQEVPPPPPLFLREREEGTKQEGGGLQEGLDTHSIQADRNQANRDDPVVRGLQQGAQ